jgi:hypothetical protein
VPDQTEQRQRRRRRGPGYQLIGIEAGALGLERVAVEGQPAEQDGALVPVGRLWDT